MKQSNKAGYKELPNNIDFIDIFFLLAKMTILRVFLT